MNNCLRGLLGVRRVAWLSFWTLMAWIAAFPAAPAAGQPAFGRMPYVWGANGSGQLADGTRTNKLTAGLTYKLPKIVGAAAGGYHTVLLTAEGSVLTAGRNNYGQLGDGTSSNRTLPGSTIGLTNVVAVAAGEYFTLCLLSDGTVRAFGRNDYGQLGDGTYTSRYAPVSVLGLTDIVAIAAGGYHGLALKSDGTVWAWGGNNYGQVGDGTVTNRTTPVQIASLSGVVAIAAGYQHSAAVLSDGTVRLWGRNSSGQLGDGTTTNRATPVTPSGNPVVSRIALGAEHTVILMPDGTVRACGRNSDGQIGDGTTTNRTVFTTVTGLSGCDRVAAGRYSSYARRSDGKWFAWGNNSNGELGDDRWADCTTPTAIYNSPSFDYLSASAHVLALTGDGELWTWGENGYGQLCVSDQSVSDISRPQVVSGLRGLVQIASNLEHVVALCGDGTVWTWGQGADGRLGYGSASRSVPMMVTALWGRRAVAVAAGWYHSMALLDDGTVWAWGFNGEGQLGDASFASRSQPQSVYGLNNVVAIACGARHSLAVKSDGSVWAWGYNNDGQLGDGTTTTRSIATRVSGISSGKAVAAGAWWSLCLLSSGDVRAWGWNSYGQLGDGTTTTRLTPVAVSGLSGVKQIAAGDIHALALKGSQVYAWGDNEYGQLGDGTTSRRLTPVPVLHMTSTVAIAAGGKHSYGLLNTGEVRSWGNNSAGQLGDGTTTHRSTRVAVVGLQNIEHMSAGYGAGYALPARAVSSLIVSNASGRPGQAVELSAVLTSGVQALSERGVYFYVDGTLAGNALTDSSGVARYNYVIPSVLNAGDHVLRGAFEGDGNYKPTSGESVLTVLRAPTATSAISRTGIISEPVTLRGYLKRLTDNAWLDGRTLAFSVDGTEVGSAVTGATGTSGRADLNWVVSEGALTRTIRAAFAGDADYDASFGTATLTCQSWGTKMATFDRTARITGRTELKARLLRSDNVPLYNKQINFYVDGTFVISRPTNTQGYASYPYYDVPDGAGAGARTILSEWPGNGGYAAISKTATLTVLKALPYIWVMPRSVPQGAVYRLYCYFRRLNDYKKMENRTLAFSIDGTWIADVTTGAGQTDPGVARYNFDTSVLSKGEHTARCDWAGDAWVDAGFGEGRLTVY